MIDYKNATVQYTTANYSKLLVYFTTTYIIMVHYNTNSLQS